MSSILTQAQIKHFSHLASDPHGLIAQQIDLIADELIETRGNGGADRKLTFLERVRNEMGLEHYCRIEDEISALESLQQQAGFLLGYYTAKHPEWLLFEQQDRGE